MDLRTSLGLFGLVIAAMISSAVYMLGNGAEPPATPRSQPGVGYYVRQARLTETADDGSPLFDLSANVATQTLADGSIALQGVRVNYAAGITVPWNLSATTGRIPAGGTIIELSGNVVATALDNGKPAATIRTDFMTYDPSTYIAATDRKVTVDYAGNTVHAVGMRAFLREDRLDFISQVNGLYTPP